MKGANIADGATKTGLRVHCCCMTDTIQTDVVVVGAGPAGLFQLFQLGLHGLQCHVIEALDHVGGQCAELYPHKPIYDIPGVPACTGLQLAELLQQQLNPFPIHWHMGQIVQSITRREDGLIAVTTQLGLQLHAKAVVLAVGAGAFVPKPLKMEGVEALLNQQIFMQSQDAKAPTGGADVVVYGGDEEAVAKVLALAQQAENGKPNSIALLHRRDVFKASQAQLDELAQLRESGKVAVRIGQLQVLQTENGQLCGLQVLNVQGETETIRANLLLVYQGISPKLGNLDAWGVAPHQKQVPVDTASFATPVAGIYAIGDIASYPGKRKLIVSAFHEATLAGYAIAEYVQQAPVPLQFTTTSSKFLQRLGKQAAG